MAMYSVNRPVRTMTLHKETCRHIPWTDLKECGCGPTGAHDNHYDHNGEMDKSNHCDDETIKIESTSDYFVSSLSFDFEKVHLTDLFFTTPLIFFLHPPVTGGN